MEEVERLKGAVPGAPSPLAPDPHLLRTHPVLQEDARLWSPTAHPNHAKHSQAKLSQHSTRHSLSPPSHPHPHTAAPRSSAFPSRRPSSVHGAASLLSAAEPSRPPRRQRAATP